MFTSRGRRAFRVFCLCPSLFISWSLFWGSSSRAEEEAAISGHELFLREWIPNDDRSHRGDGLGPQFNESSCVGCHNQGGTGGAGPSAKNVQLVSVFRNHTTPSNKKKSSKSSSRSDKKASSKQSAKSAPPSGVDDLFGEPDAEPSAEPAEPVSAKPRAKAPSPIAQREREQLAKIHPDLRTANGFVLHRFSTVADYGDIRRLFDARGGMPGMPGSPLGQMPGMVPFRSAGPFGVEAIPKALVEARAQSLLTTSILSGDFTLFVSERNTSALFGSGLIDAIPDEVLLTAARRKFDEYPDVSGRVAILKDGRLGRFGWKGQKSSLRDFVFGACAVELGLQVPGEAQATVPQNPSYEPPGLDLTLPECEALVLFVASLPAPQVRPMVHQSEHEYLKSGFEKFESVGCSVCHTPHLDTVQNIYTDLLLHDMGQELSDSGSYGGFAPNTTDDEDGTESIPELVTVEQKKVPVDETNLIGATRREWRTPPLWGVRDSAPYLHDGRAITLEQAIAFHGGEGALSARKFFKLSDAERLQVTSFLRALVAPQN